MTYEHKTPTEKTFNIIKNNEIPNVTTLAINITNKNAMNIKISLTLSIT